MSICVQNLNKTDFFQTNMKSCPNDFVYTEKRIYGKNEMIFFFTLNGLKIKNFVTKDFLRQKLMILKNQQTKKSVVYGLSQCA